MKIKKKLFIIGIVTSGRRNKLLRLLSVLQSQCDAIIDVYINENGSNELLQRDFSIFTRLRIIVFRQQEANISKARNTLLRAARSRAKWMIFIDDDCLPSEAWIVTITEFFRSKKAMTINAVQGMTGVDPDTGLFTRISLALYRLWFLYNITGDYSNILDTKCCALRLLPQASDGLTFDESLRYGSDIDLGCRLRIRLGDKSIALHRSWTVHHEERPRTLAFIAHRARLSGAFRLVAQRYPEMLRSAPLSEKIRTIGKLLLEKRKVFH
ncbi:MAG: glycosyltransferase [Candidatus Gottesmanbacteria bacterium]|nr:glycosyltransferase [Candidatus Gottesmanbacteria bacterium]